MKVSVSVLQRGKNSWRLRARWKDPETGKQMEHTQTVRGSRAFAEAQKRVLQDAFAEGRIERLSNETVRGYLLNWVEKRLAMGAIRRTTATTYKSMLGEFLSSFGEQKIVAVKHSHLAEWVNVTTQSRGKKYVAYVCMILKKAWKDACKEGLVPFNPFDRFDAPSYQAGQKDRTLDRDALRILHDAIPELPEQDQMLLWLALETGMRRGELAGLRWGAVSEDGRIEVREIVVCVGSALYRHPPKTARGRRIIRVSRALTDYLNQRRGHPEHFVLSNTEHPMRPDRVSDRLKSLMERYGFKGYTAHDLRHAHATHLLRSRKVSLSAVSRRLGHAKVTTTMQIYAHALDEEEDRIVEELDQILRDVSST